uniref:AT5G45410 protein n=1 Tax=Arabidopsis thaliana TaxID=3702 RepID=B9DHY4_ARATH|nr:AT5G45410 [Arabidopsis thaliana]
MDQECPFAAESIIQKCPFLSNINKPTNLSFSSLSFPIPVQGGKGPIFEDGPGFDSAFKLFHGKDGIVPLSGFADDSEDEAGRRALQFNPLAGKVATISLSAFGPGGPFGFGPFSEKWKKQQKKPKPSKNQQSGDSSKHEAVGDEWLKTGNCPIAKSFRAASKVMPLISKALTLPPGMKYRCPAPIVAARAALSKTALVKSLRPQPLPEKMLAIALMGMAANVPLGVWREHTKKFSPAWFLAVHAAVPFIAMLRKSVLMPKTAMALTIGASILGQVIGSRAERYRLKAVAEKMVPVTAMVSGYNQSPGDSGISGGHCGIGEGVKQVYYNVNIGESAKSTGLCY